MITTKDQPANTAPPRAVAYYRHSAQERKKNSIPIQQDLVRDWAEKHGVEIIEEFKDAGKSGLNAEGRPAFTEMMEQWVKQKDDFEYVICLDVSRRGRFQDIGEEQQIFRQRATGHRVEQSRQQDREHRAPQICRSRQ